MKRTLYVLLALCLTVISMSGAALSADAAESGQVGSCQWSLDGTVLTVSGNGSLYVDYGNAPWGKSITEVIIKEGVTTISPGAFEGCGALYKVTLPSSLRIIDSSAFSNCTSLVSITIPNGVTTIETYAFSNCSSLVDITIPKTVTHIGIAVFDECYSLNNIFVNSENTSYTSVDGVLFSKDKSVLIRYPSNKSEMTYTVPSSVKEISTSAFEAAWNLLDIRLHDGITKIGLNAFFKTVPYNNSSYYQDGCFYLGNHLIAVKDPSMTTCAVRAGTKTIGDGAFIAHDKLELITLPEGLLTIGNSAFSWCKALKSIYVPKSVIKVDDSAFYDCNALVSVLYSGSESDRGKISFGMQSEALTKATWKYNSCYGGKDHDFKTHVVVKKVTCTEDGEKRKTCSTCGAVFTETVEATGHKFGPWSQTVAPTCVSTGEEERECSACHEVETNAIDVIGHVYGPWSVEIEASCEDVGVKKRACVLCQGIEAQNIEPVGHSYGKWSVKAEPDCTEDGTEERVCDECGSVESRVIAALGHSYNGGKTVKKPTLTKTGLKRFDCEMCDHFKTVTVDKTDPTGLIIASCVVAAALSAGVTAFVIIKKKRPSVKND